MWWVWNKNENTLSQNATRFGDFIMVCDIPASVKVLPAWQNYLIILSWKLLSGENGILMQIFVVYFVHGSRINHQVTSLMSARKLYTTLSQSTTHNSTHLKYIVTRLTAARHIYTYTPKVSTVSVALQN